MPSKDWVYFSLPVRACRSAVRRSSYLALLAGWFGTVGVTGAQASDVQSSQIVGGVDAVIYICTPIDTKSAKTGGDLLKNVVVEKKIDLIAARKSDAYRSIYNSEVNRMLLMPPKERLAACQTAF